MKNIILLVTLILGLVSHSYANQDCEQIKLDKRYHHFTKFLTDLKKSPAVWNNYEIWQAPLYVSFSPYNTCFLYLQNGLKGEVVLDEKYDVDSDPKDNYLQIYAFFGSIYERDNFPEKLSTHLKAKGYNQSLLLVFPQDYFQRPKNLRTVTHEAFHMLVQKSVAGRISKPFPKASREEIDRACYDQMTLAEAQALVDLTRSAFLKDKTSAKKSFKLYKELRSQRGELTLKESSAPYKTWKCAYVENEMEISEGITEYASWKTLINLKGYGYTSEQFLALMIKEIITLPTKAEPYYLTGAGLMFVIDAFKPAAILSHRRAWSEHSGEDLMKVAEIALK